MSLLQTIDAEAKTLWDKLDSWWNGTAVPALENDERELVALLEPLFGAAEAAAMQDLVQFIRGVLTTAEGHDTLADWETAVLNSLGKLEGDLLKIAQGLGSNLLQALIALVIAKLPKA